ncbi:MAG: rRNA maturation RNase YbeY [Microcoleus sp. PH2017_10_PVI_O_A]|uniref:rRNA maturation RNase YbeY n=1 Tax=unclassified Microcoleus TaxID=2642155 RepID=UPI001D79B0DE|nr:MULTISPECIES: rRNA maturation RNase YbeY [unclassified Microcoleus]TAE80030.1 MAG: rRNA maturation RNase YbeY [Oscillatoriales cyanobacterium]MCC3407822.1 rRNA maturation RNase YbeY [Microcoleus sp. PH2017_10_PVI_O_A]MCC3461982.1 rRNA maturation RNase YbeY [Microcoleus sp. PH2017_11_PCY_U_A]MCC3480442.1 rRNA maturation RNase YbeY [Microcoleus sp. PH2017_12_PCY_D_A]MCC3532111.1 rRNA maturation RNase YbeY [Microcoleus sp. PH2017_21_RUC_O_A]
MIIEVNVEDCYGLPDADNLRENQPSGEIAAETWENWFSVWLENQEADVPEAPGYEVSLRLTADADIQALNAQYRQQDRSTDVLAFAALEVDCPQLEEIQSSEPLYLGDIVISIDTAQRQAQQQGHPLKTELAWLASHGFLHLLGWDHPDDESLTQMLDRQETLLRAIGLEIQTP